MFDLIAQTAADQTPNWLAAGGLGVCLTFTVWYAYRTASHTIPTIVEQGHKAAQEAAIEFTKELSNQRVMFKESLQTVVDHCAAENEKLDRRWDAWTSKNKPGGS